MVQTSRRPFGSVGGGEGCLRATPSAQVLVSGYHCPLKGTRDPWEKGSFQGWGRENTKGACLASSQWQEVRGCSGKDGAGLDGRRSQREEVTAVDTETGGRESVRRNMSACAQRSPNNTLANHRGTVTWQKPGGLTLPKVHRGTTDP